MPIPRILNKRFMTIVKKIQKTLLLLACVFALASNSSMANLPKQVKDKFLKLTDLEGSDFEIYINEEDINHHLDDGDLDLEIYFDASDLIKTQVYPQNIKVEIYTVVNSQRELVAILNKTINKSKQARSVKLDTKLPRIDETTEIYFDIHDSKNSIQASFSKTFYVSSTSSIAQTTAPDYNCSSSDGECLIEYFLRNVSFTVKAEKDFKTEVHKDDSGHYSVSIPIKAGKIKQTIINRYENNSSSTSSSLTLEESNLNSKTEPGTLEFDGADLYLTTKTGRKKIGEKGETGLTGATGAAGIQGPIGLPGPQGVDGIDGGGATAVGIAGTVQYSNGAGGLSGSSNQLFYDTAQSRLGINKANPSYNLDVNGSLQVSPPVSASNSVVRMMTTYDSARDQEFHVGIDNGTYGNVSQNLTINPEEGFMISATNLDIDSNDETSLRASRFRFRDRNNNNSIYIDNGMLSNYASTPSYPIDIEGTAMINGDLSFNTSLLDTDDFGSTLTVDWTQGNIQRIRYKDDKTIAFINPNGSARLTLLLTQEGGGPAAVTAWTANIDWQAGSAPSLTAFANRTDVVDCMYIAPDSKYYCKFENNYY